ncbi:unnamed protein product [Schistosoma margrebowiei]|uniref:Uncharacterized protein n=1 Tax=Schistosoma margrebowiei TaxID=48269 RepID=A0A183LBJ7_9TREM|nr:unnamed protein product [Schistosoma margrebowiei]
MSANMDVNAVRQSDACVQDVDDDSDHPSPEDHTTSNSPLQPRQRRRRRSYTDIEHIQSVCNTNFDRTATNIKSCNSDSTESSIYNDDLSLSTIAIDSVESQSSSELNETQNSCETTVSHQSIYQNSHAIVPDMVFPNDSHISDEIPCKSEENMLNEHNYGRKPDVDLIDAYFSNDPLLSNDILNGFHENISEESNPDVISYITYPYNPFDPCEKPVQCEA